jgi:hypothetical protein
VLSPDEFVIITSGEVSHGCSINFSNNGLCFFSFGGALSEDFVYAWRKNIFGSWKRMEGFGGEEHNIC